MKKNLLFIITIHLTTLITISCKKADQIEKPFSNYKEMYKDSIFLNIQGDLTNPDVIWSNMDIYSFACERMHRHLLIDTIHKRLEWNFNNASDLKISENIYKYLTDCWTYDCNALKENNYRLIKNGIYYKIDYNNSKPQTKTPQYLDTDFNLNMQMCCQLITSQVMGPLANYFDISYTGNLMQPDGYGGFKIYQERKGSCGAYHYYIFIAQNYWKKPEINSICTYQVSGSYSSGIYEKACNMMHSPVVTVFNRRAFVCSTGLQ